MATPIDDLVQELATHPERVLILAGAGVAIATNRSNQSASWVGLLEDGLQRCRDRCPTLAEKWFEVIRLMIDMKRTDDLIDAASRIEVELKRVHDGEFDRWLSESVGTLTLADDRVIRGVLALEVRIATTNYDNLFEDASGLRHITWAQGGQAIGFLRGDARGILHLHGHFSQPASVVFSSKSYEDICQDTFAQNCLRSAFTLGTVVFVGCGAGVDDPNFAGLFNWSREALAGGHHTHYHLVLEDDVTRMAQQYLGLKVTPLSYGKSHSDLGPFLLELADRVRQRRTAPDPLVVLQARQTDHDSQVLALRQRSAGLPPVEHVRQAFALARTLWGTGGRRVASQLMSGVLTTVGDQLPAQERVTYTLEAVERILEDGIEFFAARHMENLAPVIGAANLPAETLERFRRLQAHCLSQEAQLDHLLRAIQERIPLASGDERARLSAELAELHFLRGNLPELERLLTGGDR